MNLIELGSVLGSFFDNGSGPSHDELDAAVQRAGLADGDPAPSGKAATGVLGKTKRVRRLMLYATDNDPAAGVRLGLHLVDILRGDGAFEPSLDTYSGADKVTRLQTALKRLGYTLDDDGSVRPTVIDNLSGKRRILPQVFIPRRYDIRVSGKGYHRRSRTVRRP